MTAKITKKMGRIFKMSANDFKTPLDIEIPIGKGETVEVTAIGQSNVDHIKQHSNIPKRYELAEFTPKTKEQEKLVAALKENFSGKDLADVRDMLIVGGVGTGKTHISIGALNALIKSEVYCRYVTEHELLETYFRKEYTKFDGFKEVTILVIDEVGKRELVDWQMIQLEELISYRYNAMLPTIFITNRTVKEFKEFVGDRVSDRLRDNKIIRVTLDGESMRGKN